AFDVTFPTQSASGNYSLVIKPVVLDPFGNPVDQNGNGTPGEQPGDNFTAAFTIISPAITAMTPSGTTPGPVNHVRVTFNEAVLSSTFDTTDVTMTGPSGAIAVLSVVPVTSGGSSTQFDINFASQGGTGIYTVNVGPNLQDLYGHSMTAV